MTTRETVTHLYDTLLQQYGPQHWWPGGTPFEIAVGAILTQNTNWSNVEKAINNIKRANALKADSLSSLCAEELEALIRPAGYYRIKTRRLKNFLTWLMENGDGQLENLAHHDTYDLREDLLAINGIGPETADSILLYALERPTFVVDTYTARMAARHGLIEPPFDYHDLQDLFQSNLPQDTQLFNEYHALIVQVGKNFCKPRPKCQVCPLNDHAHEIDGCQ
ncbi:MAG: endonuclease III domain-containing protein [Planctomycetes bacterium]|nr:endonuclease III domain-containing protein [Planctomycetota bacterium]